jgi:hypothetical protein
MKYKLALSEEQVKELEKSLGFAMDDLNSVCLDQEEWYKKMVIKPHKSFNEEIDNSCVKFLKSKGYRPKMTREYFRNLAKRLKRKGLKIGYVIADEKEEFDGNSYKWSGVICWYIVSAHVNEKDFREFLKKGENV